MEHRRARPLPLSTVTVSNSCRHLSSPATVSHATAGSPVAEVLALDLRGNIRWRWTDTTGGGGRCSAVLVAGDSVLVAVSNLVDSSHRLRLVALDRATGKERHSQPLLRALGGVLSRISSQPLLIATTSGGWLWAIMGASVASTALVIAASSGATNSKRRTCQVCAASAVNSTTPQHHRASSAMTPGLWRSRRMQSASGTANTTTPNSVTTPAMAPAMLSSN